MRKLLAKKKKIVDLKYINSVTCHLLKGKSKEGVEKF